VHSKVSNSSSAQTSPRQASPSTVSAKSSASSAVEVRRRHVGLVTSGVGCSADKPPAQESLRNKLSSFTTSAICSRSRHALQREHGPIGGLILENLTTKQRGSQRARPPRLVRQHTSMEDSRPASRPQLESRRRTINTCTCNSSRDAVALPAESAAQGAHYCFSARSRRCEDLHVVNDESCGGQRVGRYTCTGLVCTRSKEIRDG
jgi:hypothetical protein